MSLRLDLIRRDYPEGPRWTWRMWSNSRIVSSSGSQRYTRRIDCARGAEIGAGVSDIGAALESLAAGFRPTAYRPVIGGWDEPVTVRILDQRARP